MVSEAPQRGLREAVLGRDLQEPGHQPTVSSIGIPTFHRPKALFRCAASFLDNCRIYGRKPRLLVTDDSFLPTYRAANLSCLEQLRQSYPEVEFTYAGLEEKRSYCAALARCNAADPAVLEFALFNPENLSKIACGPNRNALFLATVGGALTTMWCAGRQ